MLLCLRQTLAKVSHQQKPTDNGFWILKWLPNWPKWIFCPSFSPCHSVQNSIIKNLNRCLGNDADKGIIYLFSVSTRIFYFVHVPKWKTSFPTVFRLTWQLSYNSLHLQRFPKQVCIYLGPNICLFQTLLRLFEVLYNSCNFMQTRINSFSL